MNCRIKNLISGKYFARNPKKIDTMPPIMNLIPIITNPSPPSSRERNRLPVIIHDTPKPKIIMPAANSGLNKIAVSPIVFAIPSSDSGHLA
ncbi:hypothetical protein [Nitrososphaera sp. AFS]|uniref:hypothetical protein n=1 Tax=Nitrososphaera sp. AFS TaxID=2301191 RepID=UPI00139248A1|nr:hypothetical protein [Nitrososphaera sp. AFS]